MAIVNHAKREINAKIVYYGPEGSGKSTSLHYVYDRIKPALRGELKTLPSNGSSLLFFDFSPFEQPLFAGYRLQLHVYTLHGRVDNPAAWKMTLKGADGIMIVADASLSARGDLQESMIRLREYLGSYGLALDVVPAVLQLNKSDLAGAVGTQEVAGEVGMDGRNACLSTASRGEGVLDALAVLSRQVVDRIRERDDLPREEEKTTGAGQLDSGAPESRVCELTAAAPAEPVASDAGTGDVSCSVHVASGEIHGDNGVIKIPLDVKYPGGMRRLVVSLSIDAG